MAIQIDYNKVYSTKTHGNYKIIENLGYKNNDSRLWVKIKFLATEHKKDIRYDYIGHDIIDPYYPSVLGIAHIGEGVGAKNKYKADYDRWTNMIRRVYCPDDKDYCNYGAKGVRVDKRWLSFANYYNDIKKLPGYRFKQMYPNDFQLDKDYLQQNIPPSQRVYSKNTCCWVHKSINSKLATNSFHDELPYLDKNGNIKLIEMVTKIDK